MDETEMDDGLNDILDNLGQRSHDQCLELMALKDLVCVTIGALKTIKPGVKALVLSDFEMLFAERIRRRELSGIPREDDDDIAAISDMIVDLRAWS